MFWYPKKRLVIKRVVLNNVLLKNDFWIVILKMQQKVKWNEKRSTMKQSKQSFFFSSILLTKRGPAIWNSPNRLRLDLEIYCYMRLRFWCLFLQNVCHSIIVYYRATFKPNLEKVKMFTSKKFLHFRKWTF